LDRNESPLSVLLASSTSWLYNAPRALFGLASSASASASAPSTQLSFIADLRKKQEKSAQLQQDKDIVGLEPLPDEEEEEQSSGGGGDGNNEASPSLLEKKISKILAKLRLIAQIKNAFHYRPEADEDSDLNFNITSDNSNSSEPHQKEDLAASIDPRIADGGKAQSENIQLIPPATSQRAKDTEPTKVDLEANRVYRATEPNRLGALGVFFAELVGSVVGLTYGAFAQILSAGQSPVTVSTSEGL